MTENQDPNESKKEEELRGMIIALSVVSAYLFNRSFKDEPKEVRLQTIQRLKGAVSEALETMDSDSSEAIYEFFFSIVDPSF